MDLQKPEQTTPLMQQYFDIRGNYPDAILLFQVGDFYELFFDDAKKVAAFLGIALTSRGKNNGMPIPLCGVPVHTLDHYLTKLVRGGFKVALCDQLEVAQPGRMVRRGVTRVLTPGTLTDTALLEEKSASYLFSFFPLEDSWGLLFGEVLTAQLFGTVIPATSQRNIESELVRFLPDEILLPSTKLGKDFQRYFTQSGYVTSHVDFNEHDPIEHSELNRWINNFRSDVKEKLEHQHSLRCAVANFYSYVRMTQQSSLEQFLSLHIYKPDDYLLLDRATQRNLELVKNNHDGTSKRTLFSVIDGAMTPMGSRMIKKWVLRPLVKQEAIEQRLDVVQSYVSDSLTRQELEQVLSHIGDFERVIGRIALSRAHLHDYVHLARVLNYLPQLHALLQKHASIPLVRDLASYTDNFSALQTLLAKALNDDQTKDWIIKAGFNNELDTMRDMLTHSSQKIIDLEQQEQKNTSIASLKIRYNDVNGYYIEVTNTHKDSLPPHYVRKQTLVGRERYTMPGLHALEQEITTARLQSQQLERELFDTLKHAVSSTVYPLRKCAHGIAHIDALLGLARVAYDNKYVRPCYGTTRDITITAGRHPVIEQVLESQFIANDTNLTDQESLWIVTGPNMGGKSTYLRQVALINVLGQIGSFVPAQRANLSVLDRIFTRIGASDNLAEGKSTFLIEMEETATICTQATKNSLVILDEVGRGTSTFDGLAIAQAIVEYIYTTIGARCLFATHYHELTRLNSCYDGIANYHAVCMRGPNGGIVFLYVIKPGISHGSFGIEVAKLAHLPESITTRAEALLVSFERTTQDITG